MESLFIEFLRLFSNYTRITDIVLEYKQIIIYGMLSCAFVNCFLGFKLFRLFFSVLMFLLTVVSIYFLFGDSEDWGAVVTAFSIIGLLMAFVSYSWKKLGAFVICSCLICGFVFSHGIEIGLCLIIGLAYGIISLRMPVEAIIASTSIWGSRILAFYGISYFKIDMITIVPVTMVLLILSVVVQFLTNRNQELFIDQKWEMFRRWSSVKV